MRIRASFTLENSVIIPVFTFIIIALITLAIYFHDINVIKNALFQITVQAEKISYSNDMQIIQMQAEEYLKEKTIAVKVSDVRLEVTESKITAVCRGQFLLAGMLKGAENINRSFQIKRSYPPDCIRKLRALAILQGE